MVKIQLDQLKEAVEDCDKALAINNKFVKAYLRKAQAFREQLENLAAIEEIKKALELEPTNEEFLTLVKELKEEFEEDNALPVDHPERQRFEQLLDWLR